MKKDILIAGVGGQGILSVAFVLDNAVMESGLNFKQTEVHGMAQRGGGVVSQVRIADGTIYSDVIPIGQADVILGIEPLEALRYTDFLNPDGLIITNSHPFINIGNYPEIDKVMMAVRAYSHVIVNATDIAKELGNVNAQNVVLLGALSRYIPIAEEIMVKWVKTLFQSKGDKVVELNVKAFARGRQAVSP